MAASMLGSCNASSDDDDEYVSPSNVAVTAFSLKSSSSTSGLDSVYFSIDLNRGVIFNADSLPKGTAINKLVANITFGNNVDRAVITMTGGTTRTGDIDYKKNASDSIDFTGDVILTVGAGDTMERVYRIKMNVHKQDADTLIWYENSRCALPSRLGAPKAQKSVDKSGRAVCLMQESDNSYTIAVSDDMFDNKWEKHQITFPFTPDIDSFAASDDALYILSTDGDLYQSTDMLTWDSTGRKWKSIIGSYLETVVGITESNGTLTFDQCPNLDLKQVEIPTDFPVDSRSNFVTLLNKWTNSPVAFFTGGMKRDGSLSNATWAFDGANWILLSEGSVPAVEGCSIIPYYCYRANTSGGTKVEYSVWMLLGGQLADGSFNRTVYISYDNGVTWNPGNDAFQLPDMIPTMTQCDNIVVSWSKQTNLSNAWKAASTGNNYTIDGDIIYWDVPYIFLIGGYNPQHQLYDTIWRGVLNRLTFTPII
jgi:hypothetical protein